MGIQHKGSEEGVEMRVGPWGQRYEPQLEERSAPRGSFRGTKGGPVLGKRLGEQEV